MPLLEASGLYLFLREVMQRSLSLHERLESAVHREGFGPLESLARRAVENWRRAVAPQDPDAFARRLAWDGLDVDGVLRALSWGASLGADRVRWTEPLLQVLDECKRYKLELMDGGEPLGQLEDALHQHGVHFGSEEHPPFLEIWLPVLRVARRAQHSPTEPSSVATKDAVACLEKQLLKELGSASELVLYDRFRAGRVERTSEDRPAGAEATYYREFVLKMISGGLATLLFEFPVLARQLSRILDCWVDGNSELFQRLESDRSKIAETFRLPEGDRVCFIEPALSDPHSGRCRVARLHWESGRRIMYKPRDVSIEAAYNDFLERSIEHGLQPTLRRLKVVRGEGYGWVESAAHEDAESEETVRLFFERAGALLCVSFLLGGRDLHMENIIATREGPVLVDPEMLLQPEREHEHIPSAGFDPDDATSSSCVETGLISIIETGPEGAVSDVGGLKGDLSSGRAIERRVWMDHGKTSLAYGLSSHTAKAASNRIRFGQPREAAQHAEDIARGFASAYRFFMRSREHQQEALARFDSCLIRVLFRPTQQYAIACETLLHPRYQKDGLSGSLVLEALNRNLSEEIATPILWPLMQQERKSLLNLDIPRFEMRADSTEIPRAGGHPVRGYFCRSGLSMAKDRWAALSEDGLDRQVNDLLRSALGGIHARFEAPPDTAPDGGSGDLWLDMALWIGEELLTHGEESRLQNLRRGLDVQNSDVLSPSLELYDGLLGKGLFFSALAAVTGDTKWNDLAGRVAETIAQVVGRSGFLATDNVRGVGACSGVSSLAYGLALMGTLLDDERILAQAGDAVNLLTNDALLSDPNMDVVSGSAGAVLALCALEPMFGGEETRSLIESGANRLLSSAIEQNGGLAWRARDGRFFTGFAHGVAGIAAALALAHERTLRDEYLEAARKAYAYERSCYSPLLANWPTCASSASRTPAMNAWCHGAPGVLLSRSLGSRVFQDELLTPEFENALGTVATAAHRSDHLCCGAMGRADVLLSVGIRHGRGDALIAARDVAAKVVERASAKGHFRLKSDGFDYSIGKEGFFRGLSGIGYVLLRMARPSVIPSVLAFDSPIDFEGKSDG